MNSVAYHINHAYANQQDMIMCQKLSYVDYIHCVPCRKYPVYMRRWNSYPFAVGYMDIYFNIIVACQIAITQLFYKM